MSNINNTDIAGALRPKLSSAAAVVLPGDEGFGALAARWREYQAPSISAIVKVANEADVQETVRYANNHDIPFVVRAGGHGATKALGYAKGAIQIDLRALNHVKLSDDGKSATVGGGATVQKTIDALAAVGKRTVTGICERVGISAPTLGGGHGWLQGQYGLIADQVISCRLVLPNGDCVTVSDDPDCHPDLFWALRGAGHNFGLVTEWNFRIYDDVPEWSWEIFVYGGDKLEALYGLVDQKMPDQPAELIYWGYIIKVAKIDPEHPILWFAVIHNGPASTISSYAGPFHTLGPLNIQSGSGSLHDLAVATYQDAEGPACTYGMTSLRFPIGLTSHDVPAIRRVYDEIDTTFQRCPEVSGSFFLIEGYSTQAVQAVAADSTAFPHREDKILVTPYIMYAPNAAIDGVAKEFGEKLRGYLLEGSEDPGRLRAYVNYAYGEESMQEVYGWEDWRLEKLRRLKKQWDPEGRMRFYVPIV
ncbi:FAD-binding domain-containing protein [Astrocystis sublimbata]|nr:FAD-binding domain-containing protein [Astrocystis sublimbata]